MLSPETTATLTQLRAAEDDYMPSDMTIRQLSDKTLVMLVSGACMGKSSLMERATSIDDRLKIVGTITTRGPRDDDNTSRYTYYPHTDDGLQPLFERIRSREIIQYTIPSDYMYASGPSDYAGSYNIGDYFSSSVDRFRKYGFKQILPVTIVTEPDVWLRRFDERFPVNHPLRDFRLDEAGKSLRWSLGQPDDSNAWVINNDGELDRAAGELLKIIHGERIDPAPARKLGERCLAVIESLTP